MLGRDSEDEIWSRFVFELMIWTQPSGPLCLWQCFHLKLPDKMFIISWLSGSKSRFHLLVSKDINICPKLQKKLKMPFRISHFQLFCRVWDIAYLGFFDVVEIWKSFIEGWDNDFDTVIQRQLSRLEVWQGKAFAILVMFHLSIYSCCSSGMGGWGKERYWLVSGYIIFSCRQGSRKTGGNVNT